MTLKTFDLMSHKTSKLYFISIKQPCFTKSPKLGTWRHFSSVVRRNVLMWHILPLRCPLAHDMNMTQQMCCTKSKPQVSHVPIVRTHAHATSLARVITSPSPSTCSSISSSGNHGATLSTAYASPPLKPPPPALPFPPFFSIWLFLNTRQ